MTHGTTPYDENPISKYQALDYILGEGSNSTVFLGRNIRTSEHVALKFCDYSNLSSNSVKQLQKEVDILQKLAVCPEKDSFLMLHDVMEQEGEMCLATEYIDGGDLSDYCAQYPNGVPERIGKWVFHKLLKTMEALHKQGICHRDVKLENVMYNKDTHKLKLIDFGFATETEEVNEEGKRIQTQQRDQCGSIHYVAPEIVQNKLYDGKKSDVWALGILLFVLLSGFFPFDDSQGRREIIFDKIVLGDFLMPSYFSSEVRPLLRSMLHKDPRKRPSVHDLLKHPWFERGR